MERTIITIVGRDNIGILAKVCTYLADCRISVLDISQTIVNGYFNMLMIVNRANCTKSFTDTQADLDAIGLELGVKISCQKEEIFDMMHRI